MVAMSERNVRELEPIIFGEFCKECEALGRKVKYRHALQKDEIMKRVFRPAAVFNVRGVGGTGKSFALNSLIWNLLHNRLVEFHFITNFRYEKIVERTERKIIVEEDGKMIERTEPRVVTEFIAASKVHPRLYEADDMATAWVRVGEILAGIERDPRPVRICLIIDEAPLTKMAGGRSTQGGAGGVTSTAAGMVSLVTISRKVELLLFMAGWDETLLQRRFRSGIDEKEGTIEGLVQAVFSKNENDIRTISHGYWPGKKGKKLSCRYILDKPVQEYMAVIPTMPGWEPSLIHVSSTPLCKREEDCHVGDTTYSNKNIGGMDMGKIPGTNTPFSNDKLFVYLRNVPQKNIGQAILKFLHSESVEDKIDRILPPDEDNGNGEELSLPEPEFKIQEEDTVEIIPDLDAKRLNTKRLRLRDRIQEGLRVFKNDPEVNSKKELARRMHTNYPTIEGLVQEGLIDRSALPSWYKLGGEQ